MGSQLTAVAFSRSMPGRFAWERRAASSRSTMRAPLRRSASRGCWSPAHKQLARGWRDAVLVVRDEEVHVVPSVTGRNRNDVALRRRLRAEVVRLGRRSDCPAILRLDADADA